VTGDARAIIEEHVARRAPLARESSETDWKLACTGEEHWERESARLGTAIRELLADPDTFRKLEGVRGHVEDADLARQVELLYLDAARNRTSPALLAELVTLETRAEATFSRFRPVVDGQPLSENDLRRVLRTSADDGLRRRTWEAGKEIGRQIAPLCLEMVELRNRAARETGWSDYHTMGLKLQEIEPGELFDDVLDRLEELTEEPFGDAIATLFARLETQFELEPGGVRPWHLADPFFQEAVAPPELDLGRFFAGADLVELSRRTLGGMGFQVDDVLRNSDLFPRAGKNQHAFCMHADRMTDDVRVLANCEADEIWMDTMLHELGHAVYDLGLDRGLPWMLREAAHLITTEAIALLFGRIATNPDWMIRVLGAPAEEVDALRASLAAHVRFKQLLFPRWVMVMVHFEREMYADPRQDLNRLWWDLVERFQKVPRPQGRNEPDWASKLHIGLAPVYYQNYLLGDLVASQLDTLLTGELGTPHWFGHPGVAEQLRTRMFRDGARHPWNETVRRATGQSLDPRHYVEQFVHASA
jgi:peptidyl-dipeptidase A